MKAGAKKGIRVVGGKQRRRYRRGVEIKNRRCQVRERRVGVEGASVGRGVEAWQKKSDCDRGKKNVCKAEPNTTSAAVDIHSSRRAYKSSPRDDMKSERILKIKRYTK